MAEVGRPLDPWQAQVVTAAFGVRADGYWSAFEVVCLVPRQNGKGLVTEAIELAGLFLFGDKLIMHSAHLFKTSKNAFQRLVDIIDGSSWLTGRVHKLVRARGDEAIILTRKAGGGQLMCFSRSMGAGRGFTGDRTVFDEAAYLTIDQYAAATPTLATVPNPQIIYTGTPPDEDVGPMPANAMLPSVRARGHGQGERIALFEWSPPRQFDRTDRRVWYSTNPACPARIAEWFLAQQLANFTSAGKPEKFDTEHLGFWHEPGNAWKVLRQSDWEGAEDSTTRAREPEFQPPVALALYVNPESTWAAIGAAWIRKDGDISTAIFDHRPGLGWAVGRMVELAAKWRPVRIVVDPAGAVGAILAELNEALGAIRPKVVEITPMKVRDVCAAYGMVRNGIATLPDPDQPTEPVGSDADSDEPTPEQPAATPSRLVKVRPHPALSIAVADADTRLVGGMKAWEWKSTTDLSTLLAVTEAVWGIVTAPPPPTVWEGKLYGSAP